MLFLDKSSHCMDVNCKNEGGTVPMMEVFASPRDLRGDTNSRSKSGRAASANGLLLIINISIQGMENKHAGSTVEGSWEPGLTTIDVELPTTACVMVHRSLSG